MEDDAEDEALLLSQLEKADLHTQVKVISDGGAAYAYLSDERHQAEKLLVVFLDLELPTLTGLQILEAIRSEERLSHLPVILMTSREATDQIDRCMALGISSLVFKPITFSTFAGAVVDAYCQAGHRAQTARHSAQARGRSGTRASWGEHPIAEAGRAEENAVHGTGDRRFE